MKDLKKRFIAELRKLVACHGNGYPDEYCHADFRGGRGTMVIARGIADFYEASDEIAEDEYGNWFAHLHESLVDCIEDLRTHPRHQKIRHEYRAEHVDRYEIVDITDSRNSYAGASLRRDVERVACLCAERAAPDYAGTWLRGKLEGYFDAQSTVIHQAWMAFVRKAYRPLIRRIADETNRGNSDTFGTTNLMCYSMAGRTMFTFARAHIDPRDVTFVADSSDMVGYRSGANFHFCEAVSRINDVTEHWDMEKFLPDKKVGLG